ncbi:Protein SNQ2 [Candida viswanathii]|uniref:Protein SNQ2 n=1 Tax=Candida viswanathii TaxID=5486 RepID=A0A367YLJ0_9ASCO|nr:Protein SNQ2 [Candida viswanathii]
MTLELDEYSTASSIAEYDTHYHAQQTQQHEQENPILEGDYDDENEESRRLHLVRTISAIEGHDFDEKLDSISREISKQVTHKEGDFQLQTDEFNLSKILANFVYFAKKQGIMLRKSGVTFQDLSVYGVDDSVAIVPTVMDLIKGPVVGAINAVKKMRAPHRQILKNFNGYAKPGDMVLVLGRPGAGCTTFLKTLSGTDFDLYKKFEGDVRYDGLPQKEMIKMFKNDLIYNPELDIHFPHLTVDETLSFAIACKTPNIRINGVTRKQFVNAKKEILATVFGLRHAYQTKVGNDYVRGVSGGERKRVSIAEALACQGSIYCWDNATRGLDASTALEFAQAIRTSTKLLKTTTFVTIYQAGENIYEKFDKVTILYDGHQIYYGATDKARKYFEDMGWERPPRQSTAEFLTAITDPIGRFPKKGWENKVPRTAEDFENYWLNSSEYKQLVQEIDVYNNQIDEDEVRREYYASVAQEKMKGSRKSSPFTISYLEQLKLCLIRSYQRIKGDKAYTITLVSAAVGQAFVAGSLYYNTPDSVSGAFSRGGCIFFAVLFMSLMGLAEISASFSNRPILMKQKNYSMYHPSADALSQFVMSIPISLFVNAFFVIILYFLSNLARDAGKFFICYLFVFLLHLTMSAMFQAVAAIHKTIAGANGLGGIFMLASLMYSSYLIQRPSMHGYSRWISYINPVLYAFEAVIASEFHNRKMKCTSEYLTPSGPGYENLGPGEQVCAFTGSVPGQDWVSGDKYLTVSYTYKFIHVWRNFAILIGFLAFFLTVNALGTEYIKPITGGGDKLLFLKGKVPDHIAIPTEKRAGDIEASGEPSTTTLLEKVPPSDDEPIEGKQDNALATNDIYVWKNVDYVIPYEGKPRQLLNDVSGFCIPGTLTALMGESGAGKTTLLNVLAQRIDFGTITGDMLVNGRPLDSSFSRRTGYVQQQDIHAEELTVRESLQFAARLRRSNDVSDEEKLDYVEKIIDVLNMKGYADAIVGKLGNGLNVEQRKKLSIGVELVAKPSLLLFLDEPTSGLDSQSAWSIVKILRSLANSGQSILCTIHQPSATLFEEFDRLLLLKKGGIVTYFGDIGPRSSVILDYFERNGARHCDDNENPAEYILEAIGAGATASTSFDWGEIWANSPEKVVADQKRDELIEESSKRAVGTGSETEDKKLREKYATPYWYQFRYTVQRSTTTLWRLPGYCMSKIGMMVASGLFIGLVTFYNLKSTYTGSRNGLFCGFLTVVVAAPIANMLMERYSYLRAIFEARELLSNTYHWSLLIISDMLPEIPYLFVGGVFYFVCVYFPATRSAGSEAGIFYFTQGIFLQLFTISFSAMVLYISPDLESASVIFSFMYTFIVGFSGVVQPVSLMPGFWTFMNKLSPYTYFIQNLVSAFIHGRTIRCTESELARFNPPSGQTCGQYAAEFLSRKPGYIVDNNATSNCAYCLYSNADEYLWSVLIKYSYRWRNVGFFFAYILFNVGICLFLYYFIRYKKVFNGVGGLLQKLGKFRK